MEWLLTLLGSLTGQAFSAAGEKLADKAVPAGRPMDKLRTARRIKGDMAELYNLYTRLRTYTDQAEETCNNLCWRVVLNVLDPTTDELLNPLVQAALKLCRELLRYEGYFPLREIDFDRQLALGEIWELTKTVRLQLEFFEKPATAQKIEEILGMFLYNLLHDEQRRKWLDDRLIGGEAEGATFSVSLESLHANVAQAIESVGVILGQECTQDGLPFPRLHKKYEDNFLVASGIDPNRMEDSRKEPVMPRQARDKSPSELVQIYLAGTAFPDFFNALVPFAIPLSSRFEHLHIVGGSGHGKTQLMKNLILRDFQMLREGTGSIIVIDSQGDMFNKIQNLAAIGEMAERVLIIDPTDIDHPPALNIFDFGLDRVNTYNSLTREMLVNGAIALYEYVFGALLGAELTARQSVIFRYLALLMREVSDATIDDLIDFMQDPQKTKPYIDKLDGSARRFFQTQFFSKSFDDTRQQILTRLWGVLSNRVLERMFKNKRNKVNLFEAMNTGSLILINTAKDLLKQEGCEIFGRFFIALICQAAQERAAIDEDKRMPTFVYIDEAHDYFDESMENLLNQARKYKVGLLLAHQNLDQFEQKLRATVMASTSIKMVGGLSAKDATAFSRDMRCDPEFLQSMRKYKDKDQKDKTEFACFVRNYTHRPLRLTIPLGTMEDEPRLTKVEQDAIKAQNRARVCQTIYQPEKPPPPSSNGFPLEKPEML